MRLRNVDENNDWTFGQGNVNYLTEQKAVILDIKLRLKEWYQDCFFALENGIPYSIRLGYTNQKKFLDKDIMNTVLGTNGVVNLSDFYSILAERRYRATMNVFTLYGNEQFIYEAQI